MAELIDGRKIAADVRAELGARVEQLRRRGITPQLAVVLVGEDPASESYVRSKGRVAEECGVQSVVHRQPERTDAGTLGRLLDDLNADPAVHGILLQLPLPRHLDADAFVQRIAPAKDVDGLHPTSQGFLMQGRPRFVPCTPAGIREMLMRSSVELNGAHVVVVGRSQLVGRPLSVLLSQKGAGANATVTLCHTGTRNLADHTRRADILVVAAGRAHALGADHVAEGAVVIDVGINRTEEGKLIGDVDFEAVQPRVRAISPVPGGVGPMTVAMLIANTVQAAEGVS